MRVGRAYYLCKHCHAGHCPRDAALGLTKVDLSRGATEAVALGRSAGQFRGSSARRSLPKLSGLHVSESTVERARERVGEDVVLGELEQIDVAGRSGLVREAHRVLLVYFTNQVHRMDYPSYQSKSWSIGSGPVEAACKQVVGQRMKGTEMHWGEAGADAVCHLRALFRSEKTQWDDYWAALAA